MRHRTNAVDIMVVLVFTAMQYLYVRATASIRDNYTGPTCELPREPQSYTSTSNLAADRRDEEPPQMLPLRRPPASRARTHHLLLQRAPDAPTRTASISKPLSQQDGSNMLLTLRRTCARTGARWVNPSCRGRACIRARVGATRQAAAAARRACARQVRARVCGPPLRLRAAEMGLTGRRRMRSWRREGGW